MVVNTCHQMDVWWMNSHCARPAEPPLLTDDIRVAAVNLWAFPTSSLLRAVSHFSTWADWIKEDKQLEQDLITRDFNADSFLEKQIPSWQYCQPADIHTAVSLLFSLLNICPDRCDTFRVNSQRWMGEGGRCKSQCELKTTRNCQPLRTFRVQKSA